MRLVFVRPKEVIDVVAGMIGLLFDQLDGELPLEVDTIVETEPAGDDLTKINGIGPAFARRLIDAGVRSYTDLGGMTAEEVRQRTQLAEWQGDPEDWISQAQTLATN
jgi:predicted flap endonuclease-1-like 5' DNA nuclease